ncbi:MAG: hypothetical protein E7Z65_06340 [Thermoplasmata archaeon]|nr:hypothetical protein [Thermoplasmata archaeon]
MIDTLNGGQTCNQCRKWVPKGKRHDVFWGDVPVQSYCTEFDKVVIPSDGQNCKAFVKKLFNGNDKKG